MHRLPDLGFYRLRFLTHSASYPFLSAHWGWLLLSLVPIQLLPVNALGQDTGTAATEFFGRGVALTVNVHDPSGNPIHTTAMVKLVRGGTVPAGQTQTERGRAELVAYDLGDFTVVVEAPGYESAQKEVSITSNGRVEVDVFLRPLSSSSPSVPGRPLLAPKAKKAVDDAFTALAADNLPKARKHAALATSLAPGHPDVLYLQGVILLKQQDWSKAQEVLERATQVDPSRASAFAALGMALWDQGKFDSAVVPLEKALKLNPASPWDTRWTLARAYYQQANYDQALAMSQAALSSSNGKAPQIELLVAKSLTAVGRYEDAAQALRGFLKDHPDRQEAATARRWLNDLAADGKIHSR